jgi:RimJ/RimL family protein N-acetyltransferase
VSAGATPGPEAGAGPPVVPRLDTTRLRLRAPTLDDAPSLFARYTRDPVVTHHLTWLPHDTVERTRTFVRRCLAVIGDGSVVPGVTTERSDDQPIGVMELGLGPEPRDCWSFGRVR